MAVEDLQMTRRVMREVGKRNSVDYNLIQVRAIHGVVYLSGRVRPVRGGSQQDLKDEMGIISQNIKRLIGVRDVVVEVSYGI